MFLLSVGGTVPAGPVEGCAKLIPPERCGFYLDEAFLWEVEALGEMSKGAGEVRGTDHTVSVARWIGLPSGPPAGDLVLVLLDAA